MRTSIRLSVRDDSAPDTRLVEVDGDSALFLLALTDNAMRSIGLDPTCPPRDPMALMACAEMYLLRAQLMGAVLALQKERT